jgi:tetratricopeptide (TPR) repeat protein
MPRFDKDDDAQDESWEKEELAEEEEDDDDESGEEGGSSSFGELSDDLVQLIEETEELAEAGELKKALRLWRKSIDRFSDEPVAYFHMALGCFRLLSEEMTTGGVWDSTAEMAALHEEALSHCDECLEMDDEFIPALNLMGALHVLRDDHKEAVKAWKRSLAIDEDQPDVKQDLEEALNFLGEE